MGAGIFYYRALVDALEAHGLSPHLLMVHADVGRVLTLVAARRVDALAAYLSGLLHQLVAGGATVATIPAFAPQICAKELAGLSPIPLIDIIDAIRREVQRRAFKRVAVFGARVTVESRIFGRLEDLTEIVPLREEEIELLDGRYARLVNRQRAEEEDVESLYALAHRLIDRERLDGIVLAGTDLSLAFDPSSTNFPHVDAARVHIAEIAKRMSAK